MTTSSIALLLSVASLQLTPIDPAGHLFNAGLTWERFLDGVTMQRELWIRTINEATVPADVIDRFVRAGEGLQLIVVAEDWCPDSAYSVPYVARVAGQAGIPLRIIDRAKGEPLLRVHRTIDGRLATPTVVVLRYGVDVAAWVERPKVLQDWFRLMSVDPESARRFADRGAWYEADRGRTMLRELAALVEQTSGKK
jgi:hypothetical protein